MIFWYFLSAALKSIVLSQAVTDAHVHRQKLLPEFNSTLVSPLTALCHHFKWSLAAKGLNYQILRLSSNVVSVRQEVFKKLNIHITVPKSQNSSSHLFPPTSKVPFVQLRTTLAPSNSIGQVPSMKSIGHQYTSDKLESPNELYYRHLHLFKSTKPPPA